MSLVGTLYVEYMCLFNLKILLHFQIYKKTAKAIWADAVSITCHGVGAPSTLGLCPSGTSQAVEDGLCAWVNSGEPFKQT